MKRMLFGILLLFLCTSVGYADEGMWLPSLIGKMKIEDMRARGFQLTAEDLYDVNEGSLKDAIVRFGRGCTGEIVSNEGLLLTNHHCGYGQIQSHSSVEQDYLTHGFWAMNRNEELPNPGLTVSILVRMDDVTKQTLKGVTLRMNEPERQVKIKENIASLVERATRGNHYQASVEPFYYGNQYFLFVYEVFEDVRLVGAPPSSIGKFGDDTDNWMWPRHTGDFSVFRIYAGPDNKPAPYSKENVPYTPKRFLTISTAGAAEGDFTFVYGFPGTTTEYITSDAVRYLVEKGNPHKIHLRTLRLDIMSEEQSKDVATRIQYASKHATVANAWKKWQGELKGIRRLDVIGEKMEQEARFRRWAANKPEYREVLDQLAASYNELEEYAFARDYFNEAYRAIEITSLASDFVGLHPASLTESNIQQLAAQATSFYKNYSSEIDRRTAISLLNEYDKHVPARFKPSILEAYKERYGSLEEGIGHLFEASIFASPEKLWSLYSASSEAEAIARIQADPAIELDKAFSSLYRADIYPKYLELTERINLLYRTYMRGLMEMDRQREFYPDANSTLRIAYGQVKGYVPMDGVYYEPYTTIEGIVEKGIPECLREVYAAGDYGRWEVDGTVPVCFIATNHTTGGNSGSPILNARGELLGLNFDRTWESTMSDVKYAPQVCRNISVDIRYVLFVMDRIAGASYLLEEMRFAE